MVASVKINAGRSSGQVQGTSEIGKLTKVMTDFKNVFTKATKLGQSGLGGGGLGGIGGLIRTLTGGTAATIAGLGIGAGNLLGLGSETNPADIAQFTELGQGRYDIDPALNSRGEDVFVKTEKATGKIVEILTKQEAQQRGILDETGKLYDGIDDANGVWDLLTKDLAAVGEKTVLTKDNLGDIADKSATASLLWDDIVTALQEQKTRLNNIPNFSALIPNQSDIGGGQSFQPPPAIDGVNFSRAVNQSVLNK